MFLPISACIVILLLLMVSKNSLRQSLEDEIVSETVLRIAGLQSWHSLSYGRLQV